MNDRYEIIGRLGTGGMGTVWKARDLVLGRTVAIKRLPSHLTADEASAARLIREAQAAASLTHPGIVTVYDTGRDEEGPFIVLEMIEGETLAARIVREGPFATQIAADLIDQAAQALDYAHMRGVVHRDIKPSNLMIDHLGRLKLTDFGIAHVADAATLTSDSSVLGTLVYMAPELIDGQPATPSSDIYSLGAVAHEIFTGEPPFEGAGVGALVTAIRSGLRRRIEGLDPVINAAISEAMSPDPRRRFQTAAGLAAALTGTIMPLGRSAGSVTALSRDDQPTRVLPATKPPTQRRARSPWRAMVMAGFAALAALLVIAAALDAVGPPDPRVVGTSLAPMTQATATTAAVPVTTSATPSISATTGPIPTTTVTAAEGPAMIAAEIRASLDDLDPDKFKRKQVRDVESGLDEVMEKWDQGERNEIVEAFEEQLIPAISELENSPERENLTEAVIRLAESMGFEVRASEDDGRGNGDDRGGDD